MSVPCTEKFQIPVAYKDAMFKKVDWNPVHKEELKNFCRNPQGFYLFCGQSGRGKTYAAVAILHACWTLNNNLFGRYASAADLYMLWKHCARNYGDDLDLAEKYINPHVFLLDDIGLRTPTDGFLEFLYSIVNRRLNEKKATLITTNLTSQEMSQKFGEALTSRFCSGKIIKFEGKDRRIYKEF
jgi:DNA replication protein DnaC